MAAGIFISYRRDDTAYAAGRLVDYLAKRYHRDQLVIDVDTLAPGIDFLRALLHRLDECGVLLAIIGPRWINARDENGVRRLDHPHDVVRIEIQYGLTSGKRVIPVLVDGTPMPGLDQLPDVLKPLQKCNAVHLRHEHFRIDADELLGSLLDLVPRRTALGNLLTGLLPKTQSPTNSEAFLRELEKFDAQTSSKPSIFLPTEQNGVHFLPVMMPKSIYMERFLIKGHLGRGGFSDVYLAQDLTNKHVGDVALKLFCLDRQNDWTATAIEHELDMWDTFGKTAIRGLVVCHETGVLPRKIGAFVVLEYVPSTTLHEFLLVKRKLSVAEALAITAQIAGTLVHLHQKEICHCDVNPSNILLPHDSSRPPHLNDLGACRAFKPGRTIGGVGVTAVTIPYAAPELVSHIGHPDQHRAYFGRIDGRVDVFSLAVTLLHMLQGLPRFEFEGGRYYDPATMALPSSDNLDQVMLEDDAALKQKQREDHARSVLYKQRVQEMYSNTVALLDSIEYENLREVLRRALAQSRDDRFRDMVEFKDEIERLF